MLLWAGRILVLVDNVRILKELDLVQFLKIKIYKKFSFYSNIYMVIKNLRAIQSHPLQTVFALQSDCFWHWQTRKRNGNQFFFSINIDQTCTFDTNWLMVHYLALLIQITRIWSSAWICTSTSHASFLWWTAIMTSASDFCNLRLKN